MDVDNAATDSSDYIFGYGREQHAMLSRRTAAHDASFLMPLLRPGMRLLDCGAGPGAITLGLAEAVAPGEVVGIDLSQAQVDRASDLAKELGVTNVRFEAGSVYELPFPDASFDVAFANATLMHLRDPLAALREMRRVVRPGGIVAARDHGLRLNEPRTPVVERLDTLRDEVAVAARGRPGPPMGMRHRQLMIESGCSRCEGFADTEVFGNPATLQRRLALDRGILQAEELRRHAAEIGWDAAALDALADDFAVWTERPDAMVVIVWSAAIGWVE